MLQIEYDRKFKKHFRQRIFPNKNLSKKFENRLALFIKNPSHPLLNDHPLKGARKEFRSFRITGDIRIIDRRIKDTVFLYDIGTHNQVY